jgi:Type II secretion system (T2SS), protein G
MLRDPSHSSTHHATSGFALAALVLATVAIVVPELADATAGQAHATALGDANAIGAALSRAITDAGDPRAASAAEGCDVFFGPGVLPRGRVLERAQRFPLSGVVASDRIGAGVAWKGPYLAAVPIDPWGRAYVVIMPAKPGEHALVVSAGRDGVVSTPRGAGAIAEDDVGIVLMP